MSQPQDTTDRATYSTREAAQRLGTTLIKLQRSINEGLVSAPALKPMKDNPRFNPVSTGHYREWTDADIERVRPQLAAIPTRCYWPVAPEHQGRTLYSTERAAEKLSIPRSTLLNWISVGKAAPTVRVTGGRWAGKLLWTEADIAKLAGTKPRPYRQATPGERKRKYEQKWHHDYYEANKPQARARTQDHLAKHPGYRQKRTREIIEQSEDYRLADAVRGLLPKCVEGLTIRRRAQKRWAADRKKWESALRQAGFSAQADIDALILSKTPSGAAAKMVSDKQNISLHRVQNAYSAMKKHLS